MKMKSKMKISRIMFFLSLFVFLGIAIFGSYLLYSATDDTIPDDPANPSLGHIVTRSTISPIKTPVNILLMAAAIRGDGVKLTDTMMVVHFDPVTCNIKIISVLRDTEVISGYRRKINSVYQSGGPEEAAATVSKLLGINIDYYVYFSGGMIRSIVDALGGVWFDVPCRMKYSTWIDLQKGPQLINGAKVVQLLRFRHPDLVGKDSYKDCEIYITNDVQRAKTQQSFLSATIKQKAKPEYFNKIAEITKIVYENMETNIKFNTILRLLYNKTQISVDKLTTYSIDSINSIYSGTLHDNTNDKSLTVEETNALLTSEFGSSGLLSKASLSDASAFHTQILAGFRPVKNTPNPTKEPAKTPKPTPIHSSGPVVTPKPRPTASPNPTAAPTEHATSPPTSPPKTPAPTDVPPEPT